MGTPRRLADIESTVTHRWWRVLHSPASIYGTLIGASVIAASDDDEPVAVVAAVVITTQLIYWAAERWSSVLAAQLGDDPPSRRESWRILANGWPMVQASFIPLLVMVVARLGGASNNDAEGLGLLTSVILLVMLGAFAGHRAGVSRWAVVGSATFTGVLGIFLIVLKSIVH